MFIYICMCVQIHGHLLQAEWRTGESTGKGPCLVPDWPLAWIVERLKEDMRPVTGHTRIIIRFGLTSHGRFLHLLHRNAGSGPGSQTL